MPLMNGARLGAYEILALVGAGGMGEVYKARDTRVDRTVAIKILPDTLAADPQFRERFDREARALSRFTHPNICTLYDVGEAPVREPSTDSHQPSAISHATVQFLVMELLDGKRSRTDAPAPARKGPACRWTKRCGSRSRQLTPWPRPIVRGSSIAT